MKQAGFKGWGMGGDMFSQGVSTLQWNFIHFKHHPQALIAFLDQLNAPLSKPSPSEKGK